MATSATTYPKLGGTAWRTLRARAAQAPSSKFIPATVAAIMGHDSPASAAQNVVSPMLKLGLIDENGILTDRGNKWRNDATYAEACQEILDEIYPSEMAGFTTADGSPDKAMVTKWFQHQKFGDSNARQMATTYVMVAEKKVPEAGDKEAKPGRKGSRLPALRPRPPSPPLNPPAMTPRRRQLRLPRVQNSGPPLMPVPSWSRSTASARRPPTSGTRVCASLALVDSSRGLW